MTPRMQAILDRIYQYNARHLAQHTFGLSEETVYDALVVAPSYAPRKIITDSRYEIRETGGQSYCTGYEVEGNGLKLAWIKTAAGGCNMLDYLSICGELQFKRLIFIGAVGALKPGFEIGDLCTPSFSVAGTMANAYLKEHIRDYQPFEKVFPDSAYLDQVVNLAAENGIPLRKASVFCTDSISMEYTHLDEIRAFGTDLIEMETATFYALAEIMGVPAVALLVVSDNSATGAPLVGRSEELQQRYEHTRRVVLMELIGKIAGL